MADTKIVLLVLLGPRPAYLFVSDTVCPEH